MTEPTLPTPDELGTQNDPTRSDEEESTEEGERYQGGEIPRTGSEETENDN
jgi:hypothetical protein